MKALLLASVLFAAPAYADGLTTVIEEPEVMKPAFSWTGFYIGASARHSSDTTETTRCYKLGAEKACDDPIFEYYPEYKEVVTTSSSTSSTDGAVFAGYRHDFDPLVLGIEASSDPTIELQAGVGANRVLFYGLVGTNEDASFYGAGVDVALGNRLLLGVKYTDDDVASLRVGVRF